MKTIKIVAIMLILFGLAYWIIYAKHNLAFHEFGKFLTTCSLRTSDGLPYDPHGWVWFSICDYQTEGFNMEEIDDYLSSAGLTLDKEHHTYIIVRGYILEEVFIRNWYSNWYSKSYDGKREWIGFVILNDGCPPDQISIYELDDTIKVYPAKDYRTEKPFVVIHHKR